MSPDSPARLNPAERKNAAAIIILRKRDDLWNRRYNFDNVAEQLARYIIPYKSNIITKRSPGEKQTEFLFDSTAIKANENLASFIAGSLTNMAIRFFNLRTSFEDLAKDPGVSKWLDDTAKTIYSELKASNFSAESQELYLDLGCFGTGCMLQVEKEGDEVFNGFMFRSEPFGYYAITEDPEGNVNGVWRDVSMTAHAVVQKFGENKVSDKLMKQYKTKPFETHQLVHAVFPKGMFDIDGPMNKDYWSVYVEKETKHTLEVGGFEEFPFYVPRWKKTAGEEYGRGPGHTALPDIRTLNKADELTLKAWAKALDPPMLALADQIIGKPNTRPAAITIGRTKDALTPIPHAGRWDINATMFADRRQSIRNIFFADQLQLPDKTIITATEVERRLELMQQVLGPVVGRLEQDFLNRMISRSFKMLQRAGRIMDYPDLLKEAAKTANVQIDVQYEGPLSRAQRGGEIQALNRLFGASAAYMQLNPRSQMLDNLEEDKLFRFLVEVTGSPSFILRREADVRGTREVRAQQMQQQMLAQNAPAMASAAKAGAEADKTAQEAEALKNEQSV